MAEIPVDLVRRTFETNVFSDIELTRRVIRKFVDTGTAGRIVIVSSMGGLLTVSGVGGCVLRRMADTTYRWHDDAVNFTREASSRPGRAPGPERSDRRERGGAGGIAQSVPPQARCARPRELPTGWELDQARPS